MKKPNLRRLALLLAVLLCLSGCAVNRRAKKETTAATEPPSSAPAEPTETETEPEPTEPEPEPLPAVEKLSLRFPGGILETADAGDGRAAVICSVPDSENPDWANDVRTLYLVDTQSGQLLAQRQLSALGGESLIGVRKNGEVLLRNYSTDKLDVYDPQLTYLRGEEIPENFTAFDRESDALYCVDSGEIRSVSLSDGRSEPVFSGLGATLDEVDALRGRLLLGCRAVRDTGGWDFALYDLQQGAVLLQGSMGWEGASLAGGRLIAAGALNPQYDPETGEETADPDRKLLDVYDPEIGALDCGWILPFDGALYSDVGSDCIIAVTADWGEDGESNRQQFYLIDPLNGRMHELTAELETSDYVSTVCLRSDGSWLIAATSGDYPDTATELYLIRPAFTEMETDLDPAPRQSLSGRRHEAGPLLQELRERADRIEQTYGVKILLGDEVLDMADNGSYTLISLTDEDGYANEEDALFFSGNALDVVEQALAFYPEGFFDTFRDFRGEGGLRIALVANLENRWGEFSAGGIHYPSDAWYNIVLDADNLGARQTVHHEMWHACESRINDAEPGVFSPDNWNVFNPPGFEYTQDFEVYSQRTDIDGYLMGWTEEPWFAQTYSTVTPMEDRSTLVETMLEDWYDADFYGYPTAVAWVCSYPHLQAKVRYMHDAVERVFGECYWQMP